MLKKLICINNNGYEGFLTVGKIYYGLEWESGDEREICYHSINNDRSGNKDYYKKELFVTIDVYRDNILKEFGI